MSAESEDQVAFDGRKQCQHFGNWRSPPRGHRWCFVCVTVDDCLLEAARRLRERGGPDSIYGQLAKVFEDCVKGA